MNKSLSNTYNPIIPYYPHALSQTSSFRIIICWQNSNQLTLPLQVNRRSWEFREQEEDDDDWNNSTNILTYPIPLHTPCSLCTSWNILNKIFATRIMVDCWLILSYTTVCSFLRAGCILPKHAQEPSIAIQSLHIPSSNHMLSPVKV